MQDLLACLEEARGFHSQAKQPRVKQLLFHFMEAMSKEQKQLEDKLAADKEDAAAARQQKHQNESSIVEKTITQYSWDENESELKLYFSTKQEGASTAAGAVSLDIRSFGHQRRLEIRCTFSAAPVSSSNNNNDNDDDDHHHEVSKLVPVSRACLVLYPLKHSLEEIDVSVPLEIQQDGAQKVFQTPKAGFVYPDAGSANSIKSGNGPKGNCRVKVKPNGDAVVIITKESDRKWSDLLDVDDFGKPLAFGPANDPSVTAGAAPTANAENAAAAAAGNKPRPKYSRDDPEVQKTASLVSLMQQMYKDGDDTMKKTIEEAWKESRNMQ